MSSGTKVFIEDVKVIKKETSKNIGNDKFLIRKTYGQIKPLHRYLPENEKVWALKLKDFLKYTKKKFPEISDRDFIVVEIVSKQLSSTMKGKKWQTFKEAFKEVTKTTLIFSLISIGLISLPEKSKIYISNAYVKTVNFIVTHTLNIKTGILTNYHRITSSQSFESNFKAVLWIIFYLFLAYVILSIVFSLISGTVSVFKNRYKILKKGNIGKAFFFPYLILILSILDSKDISSVVTSVLIIFFHLALFLYWHTAYRFLKAKVAKEIARVLDNVCLKEF